MPAIEKDIKLICCNKFWKVEKLKAMNSNTFKKTGNPDSVLLSVYEQ